MRVLHIDGARTWGGGQNQIRLLMHGLRRRGSAQLCLCPAGGRLHERLLREDLPVRGIAWTSAFDPRALGPTFREASRHDVIHAHDSHALQVALLTGLPLAVPIVAARRVRFRTRRLTWGRADRIVCVSDSVREHVRKAGIEPRKLVTIHSGVDLDELARLPAGTPPLRERLGIPGDRFLAGTVGTLLEYKHQERIVEAAAVAPDDIAWVIVGDGPRRETLQALIAEHGVEDRVRLAGQLPDARRFLHELDVFVMTSIGEALGTSVLDAMALGIPVVASDSAGPAEVLAPVHERTRNSLVEPEDGAGFAAAVSRFRDDAGLRDRAVAAQLERVRDFSIDRTVEKTLAVYASVIGG